MDGEKKILLVDRDAEFLEKTEKMSRYEVGEAFTDVVGPLGVPSHIEGGGKEMRIVGKKGDPVPIEGSEHSFDVDIVIMAIGQGANPLLTKSAPDLALNKWGYIVADEETGRTSKEGVFAGGDIVTGAATVILAMGAGRKAARSIHEYLERGVWEIPPNLGFMAQQE